MHGGDIDNIICTVCTL